LGTELVSVGQPFIELGDLVSQNPDFLFQDLLGLFGSLTGLLSPVEFVSLSHRARVELTDPTVAFNDGLLELLNGAPMGRFPITQLDLQLMDTDLCRFQLLDLGTESVLAGKVFVELGDLFVEDTDFLLL
jgi:hypothetical protein